MKIQMMSDLHNEFIRAKLPSDKLTKSDAYIKRNELCSPAPLSAIESTDSNVIVLAGDIDIGAAGVQWAAIESKILDKDIIYIAGNHEFYGNDYHKVLQSMRTMSNNTRVHFLDNDCVVIDNVRFLGTTLWTDYKVYEKWLDQAEAMVLIEKWIADHKQIRFNDHLLRASDALAIHEQSVAWLQQELAKPFNGKTVVITHHAPSPRCAHYEHGLNEMSVGFISDLEHLMGKNVDLWIYGHTHSNLDTSINGTRVISNQPGYPNEVVPGFDSHLVVSV